MAAQYDKPRDIESPNLAVVGRPAPYFKATALMPDGSFGTVSLSDYAGRWLVLYSYPLDFTFVCPTEIIAFNDKIAEFNALNTAVVGFSVDSEFAHLAWTQSPRKAGGLGGPLAYPLLADKTHQIHRDYGVLVPDEGDNLRGLFIINPKGVLMQATINFPCVGRNVDEVLRLVAAYQFAEEHGEVCPASWSKANKATIKTDPNAKLAYFAAANQ